MNKNEIIEKTTRYVKSKLISESTGHDWWHSYRIWKMALKIAKTEKNVDLFVIQLAALLHDIADWKFHKGDDDIAPKLAKVWLEKLNVNRETIATVSEIIKDMSFKGAGVKFKMKTQEGKIVQDADRLDAIGVIGIARCFSYGGYKRRPIHNPNIKPIFHKTFKEYKTKSNTSLNHFYEKLLLLKNLMNTKTAKKIAERRHKYMKQYLNQFSKEWEGKD